MSPARACPLLVILACNNAPTTPTQKPDATAASADAGSAAPADDDAGLTTLPDDAGGATPERDAGTATIDAATTPDASTTTGEDECTAGERACLAFDQAVVCSATPGGLRWQTTTCASGEGCLRGACVADACSDECHLGESNAGRDCRLWDIGDGRFVSVDDQRRLHDRARTYEKWIVNDTDVLLHDGIVYATYSGSDRRNVDSVYIGDTALHTGVYMAAEAFRLQATGSWRARKNVRNYVDVMHLWLNVSGDPGNLATITVPAGDRRIRDWTDWDCSDFDRYCNVAYDGRRWDYVGDPSRDMYVGPLMGMVAAYDALGEHDESHREILRRDLVTIANELIRLRTIPMRLVLNGARLPVRMMQTRFFIPEQGDLIDGAVEVTFSTSDLDGGDIRGGQEFLPNPPVLFRQFNSLSWLPDVPRASSAIMVAAFLAAAMHVTEGVPAYAAERQSIEDFYYRNTDEWGNVDQWLGFAERYSYDKECGQAYFGLNIAFLPMYVLAALERDPARLTRVRDAVLRDRLWAEVENHKNVMFSFIYAGTHPNAPASVGQQAAQQIAQFRRPPLYPRDVDVRSQYAGRESGCSNQVDHSTAVDVGDRAIQYFMWHSHPWDLVFDGNDRRVYPGHDYLIGYWMGRAFGFVDDDTSGRCLRFD